MNNGCFIPTKIKVGYQKRENTYSGKLAYIIYYDEKDKLRKENSWNSWREEEIQPDDFDNELLEGFVLNKKAGDYHGDWFNSRQAYIRVFDPRGFEIEITVNNLLYILENCDCIKGKGLVGRFCYGWYGTELILLPECSEAYRESKKYTENLFGNKSIKKSELKIGNTYILKKNKKVIYLGYYKSFSFFRCYYSNADGIYYGYKHYYISVDNLNDWGKGGYDYFNESENFKPIAMCDEKYDCSNVITSLQAKIYFTGKAICRYTEKEIKDALKSCKKGFYAWEKSNFDKIFIKKQSNDCVIYHINTKWISEDVEYSIKELLRNTNICYCANFVNGNMTSKEYYLELE